MSELLHRSWDATDAHNAGFTVGEDLSVTDTRTTKNPAQLAARQSQAQVLAADIRARTAQLVGLDNEVGTNLVKTAGDVGETNFAEGPIYYGQQPINVGADPRNGTIQLAGHGFKLDGGTPPPPGFVDQYEQQLTSAGPKTPPPPIPMPSSGPLPPFVPQQPGPIPPYLPPRTSPGFPETCLSGIRQVYLEIGNPSG